MYDWDLEKIYNGVNSSEYKKDFEDAKALIEDANKLDFSKAGDINTFKNAFKILDDINTKLTYLFEYISLRVSCNTEDIEALKAYGALEDLSIKSSEPEIKLVKYIKTFDNFIEEVKKDEYLAKFEYYCTKLYDSSKRMLNDETELMINKLDKSGGSAWGRLFDTLTSTLEVEYDGKIITLPDVRNLAYSGDALTRKKAYEAELKSYKKIEKSIAASLSSIKQQVTTVTKAKGYKEPIEATLDNSGMTRKTLDALTSAIEDYYPIFRKYLKRKGELLGHKNGLPFYDLFAPIGKEMGEFKVEDAKEYLVSRFNKFNPEISNMMEKAFDNNWIDFFPKNGKQGGAFCESVFKIDESRILTNFDGTFGAVVTLAHELGHAYHNEVLWGKPILYSNYPMQLAETASTFNETFIKDDAIRNAKSKEEMLNVLENSIADDTQVIVDIMSRYYFEKSVFERSEESALTPEELCDLMKDAQLRSYGDGLDKDYLHPYMWCCKSHYYSSGLSFYNFPYAFGQLFAYGLYQIYKEKGNEFFDLYKKVLTSAGSMPIRECVLQASIDVESKEFWTKSLDLVKDKIELFLKETEF